MHYYEAKLFRTHNYFNYLLFFNNQITWGDYFYILLIIYFFFILIFRFKKIIKHWVLYSSKLLLLISSLYFLFTMLWGANYQRQAIYQMEEENLEVLGKEDMLFLYHYFREQVDLKEFSGINDYDFEEYAINGASIMQQSFGNEYPWIVKSSSLEAWIKGMGISGYYHPFTAEAYVNSDLPIYILPSVILHELSHQAGIAKENEANFMAYQIAMISGDDRFIQSANFQALLYVLNYFRRLDKDYFENFIYASLDEELKTAYEEYRTYHLEHRNFLDRWSTVFFDYFLKSHGQEEGTATYALYLNWIYDEINQQEVLTD